MVTSRIAVVVTKEFSMINTELSLEWKLQQDRMVHVCRPPANKSSSLFAYTVKTRPLKNTPGKSSPDAGPMKSINLVEVICIYLLYHTNLMFGGGITIDANLAVLWTLNVKLYESSRRV